MHVVSARKCPLDAEQLMVTPLMRDLHTAAGACWCLVGWYFDFTRTFAGNFLHPKQRSKLFCYCYFQKSVGTGRDAEGNKSVKRCIAHTRYISRPVRIRSREKYKEHVKNHGFARISSEKYEP